MKILLLLLLPLGLFGQSYRVIDGKEYVITPMDSAARIAYWGEKGVECEPLIDSMEMKIELQEKTLNFEQQITARLKDAQAEYRLNLENCAKNAQKLTQDNLKIIEQRDDWKDKAKRRGRTIGAIAGVAVGIIILTIAIN